MIDDLKEYVREIDDYPVEGIKFKDIGTVLSNPQAFRQVVSKMESLVAHRVPDAIVSPDARGWLFAAPVAYNLGLPLYMARKPNKLPPETVCVEYDYEYASGELHLSADADLTGKRVAIIDDVNATGGTALALRDLVLKQGADSVSYFCFIDILGAGGNNKLHELDIDTGSVLFYEH